MNNDQLTLVGEKRLRELLEHEHEVLKYCLGHTEYMWSSYIAGIILGCDFREVSDALIKKRLGIKIKDEAMR